MNILCIVTEKYLTVHHLNPCFCKTTQATVDYWSKGDGKLAKAV